MRLGTTKEILVRTVSDVQNNHTMAMAAGLSYYFVMALFPTLAVAAAALAYIPLPNSLNTILDAAARVVPPEGMGLVRDVASDIITAQRGTLLSLGVLGSLWTVSSGFSALIEALDVAYDVPETRSWWGQRLLAVAAAVVVGLLTMIALAVMLAGPRFGDWLASVGAGPQFVIAWPVIRWGVAIAFTILAVELMYFLLPNVKQSFRQSLPGAVVAVGVWMALSFGLSAYFQHFAHFNRTYGTLGAGIALMVWMYWSGFAILLGAEINSEAIQVTNQGKLALKKPPPRKVYPKEPPKDADEIAAA